MSTDQVNTTRWKWWASLTQHGEKPPAMLKFRSSDGFIIGTVALAVFTVSTSSYRTHMCDGEWRSELTWRRICFYMGSSYPSSRLLCRAAAMLNMTGCSTGSLSSLPYMGPHCLCFLLSAVGLRIEDHPVDLLSCLDCSRCWARQFFFKLATQQEF